MKVPVSPEEKTDSASSTPESCRRSSPSAKTAGNSVHSKFPLKPPFSHTKRPHQEGRNLWRNLDRGPERILIVRLKDLSEKKKMRSKGYFVTEAL